MNTIQRSTYEHIKNNIDGVKVDVIAGTVDSVCKTDRDGYLFINLGGLPIRVHHIIGYFIFGERMIGKQINHFDGNKSNNRADNLEVVTPSHKTWTHVSDDETPYVTTLNEYQRETRRTANDGLDTYNKAANFTIGLVAEGGEVADIVKKALFHGHELDKEDLTNELGDVLWYLTQVADTFNISLEEIANMNVHKLFKRYPEGFSEEDSRNRKN